MGYGRLLQFMHEEADARTIAPSLDARLHGVFNVAGPAPLPLSTIFRGVGHERLPIPEPLLRFAFGRFGLPLLAPRAIAHLKDPVVVDPSSFQAATGFEHLHDQRHTY